MSKYLNGTKLFEIERQLEDLPIDIRIVKKENDNFGKPW